MDKNYKILHFEDEQALADILAKEFSAQNFKYKHYINPPEKEEEFINLVLSENPDLIIMDILMPKVDGFTATKILKNNIKTKNIPVIGISNMSDQETVDMAKECKMVDYFITSEIFFLKQFVKKVKEYLEFPNSYKPIFDKHKEIKIINKSVEEKINKQEIQQLTNSKKSFWNWHGGSGGYMVVGAILYYSQCFSKPILDETIIVVVAVGCGSLYYRCKSKLKIKNEIVKIVITFFGLLLIASFLIGILTALAHRIFTSELIIR